MKTVLALVSVGMMAALTASATVCANISQSLSSGGSYSDTTDTCSVDGVTFSDFTIYAGSGYPASPSTSAATLQVSVIGNQLIFGTNGLGSEDLTVYFQATPGNVTSLTLSGSAGESATETVCSGTITLGSQACNPPGTELNNSTVSVSGNSASTSSVTRSATQTFSVSDSGGSSLSQGFVSAAPEPMALSLVGLGLLGIAAASRRVRK